LTPSVNLTTLKVLIAVFKIKVTLSQNFSVVSLRIFAPRPLRFGLS
jgi:hypothetical protein